MKNDIETIQQWSTCNFNINNPTIQYNLYEAKSKRLFLNISNSSAIYIFKNIINNKLYIGSTQKITTRISTHLQHLDNGNHHSKKLQNAINKYGYNSFQLLIYLFDLDRDFLYDVEEHLITLLDSYKNGYNMVIDSRGKTDYSFSDETRQKMSNARKGVKHSEEHNKKVGIAKSLQNSGEGNPKTHLTKENVLFIRNHVDEFTVPQFEEMFNIKSSAIKAIIHLRSWQYEDCIPEGYMPPKKIKKANEIPIETVLYIRIHKDQFTTKQFCSMFNIKDYQVRSIITLKTYKDPKYIPENYE